VTSLAEHTVDVQLRANDAGEHSNQLAAAPYFEAMYA